MKWTKLGQVIPTMAANPFAERLDGDLYRVYFSPRDGNRAYITWMLLDIRNPTKPLYVSDERAVNYGEPGLFDDSGASMGWKVGERIYYLGWNLGVTVPWRNAIGVCENGKKRLAPVMDRSEDDPYSLSYPCIIKQLGIWEMYYGSNLAWGKEKESMQHVIKRAVSNDGLHWNRAGVAIDLKAGEYALSKPCVIGREMWYSYKGNQYRIGYAYSEGYSWERRDEEAGITVSDSGWDSEAIGYAHVFEHRGQRYMLYNGNGHGKTGFGIAIQDA